MKKVSIFNLNQLVLLFGEEFKIVNIRYEDNEKNYDTYYSLENENNYIHTVHELELMEENH